MKKRDLKVNFPQNTYVRGIKPHIPKYLCGWYQFISNRSNFTGQKHHHILGVIASKFTPILLILFTSYFRIYRVCLYVHEIRHRNVCSIKMGKKKVANGGKFIYTKKNSTRMTCKSFFFIFLCFFIFHCRFAVLKMSNYLCYVWINVLNTVAFHTTFFF